MIKTIALDDEPPALQVITNFCSRIDFIDLQQTFCNTEEAHNYVVQNDVDLLFLDINMPSLSGIDFYKKLSSKAMVVFTTAYTEYAIESFTLNAVDYLLKPFTFQRFVQASEKARDLYNFYHPAEKETKPQFAFLKVDYGLLKITLDDIIFIEGLDDYLKIHLVQQKPLIVRLTMKAMLDKLPVADFIRVHRSYIIAYSKIAGIRNKTIFIAGLELPIGSSYEAAFLARFNK